MFLRDENVEILTVLYKFHSDLVHQLLEENGLHAASIHLDSGLELPGYFRPEKKWDMLVIHELTEDL